jgi:1-acyl-sn-glycerol-3-phosphate acyltransferase
VVLLSSAAACEPSHRHPGHVAESWPAGARAGNAVARAWLALEALAGETLGGSGGRPPVVLRPVAVAAADGGDLLARLAARRLAVRVAGHDPAVQALALDDLAEAVARAAERGVDGERYHVAPEGALPVRLALRAAGALRLPLPYTPQRFVRALLARLSLAAPAAELAYLRHPATVSAAKIRRELGFVARRSTAEALATLRRGRRADAGAKPEPDRYGMSRSYIDALGRTLFRFLDRVYWRIEVAGLEHVPREGRAMLTGVHRGFMPWDGVMTLHTVARAIGRYPRFLIHPCLVKFPFLADFMTRLGGILACRENADWVLAQDELLGMYPEGIAGAFTPYRRAYRLGSFAGFEYVRTALRNRAPIVPFVTVGSAEIYPILGRLDWKWVKRATEWPFLPLAPNFPFPGLPLPSKWHTRFLPPLPVQERYGPEAAADPEVVAAISGEVRARMQAAIDDMLARRRSVFRGSVFEAAETA